MAGNSLTLDSSLKCPHGGQVVIATSNTRVGSEGSMLVTAGDNFQIVGCPFMIPSVPPIPSPCVMVQWLVPDTRVKLNSSPTLSESSVGLCLSAAQMPQGPVLITPAQAEVSTQ